MAGRSAQKQDPGPDRPVPPPGGLHHLSVTLDYSPARLNIFFDAETGIVKEVKCG